MLLHVVGQRVAIEFACALVSQVRQVVSFKLDTVYLVVAAQSVYHFLALFGGQGVLAFLIAGKLMEKLFLSKLVAPFILGAEALGNGEERHDGAMVYAVYLHLVQYLGGIGQRLGYIGKHLVHLAPCLKPLLL